MWLSHIGINLARRQMIPPYLVKQRNFYQYISEYVNRQAGEVQLVYLYKYTPDEMKKIKVWGVIVLINNIKV